MIDLSEYQSDLQTRNYDAWSVSVWAIAIPFVFALAWINDTEWSTAALLVTPGVLLTLYHAPRAWLFHRGQLKTGSGVEFMTIGELVEWVKNHPGRIYLGKGFPWTREQAGKAKQLENSGYIGDEGNDDGQTIGVPWMHALGNPVDVSISEKQTEGHVLIYGTTGAGKTRMLDLVTSQAIIRDEAVLVFDPKGDRDLRDKLKRTCEAVGQPERFVMIHPGFPEAGIRINPLSNFTRGSELSSRIASLISSETGSDPFTAFSEMVLKNIINGMLLVGEKPSLVAINSYMTNGVQSLAKGALVEWCQRHMPDWEARAKAYTRNAKGEKARVDAMVNFYREEVRKHAPSSDLDNLLNLYEHDREHMQKMVTSLMPVLASLTAGEIGPLLSPDPDDTSDPREIGDLARLIENGSVFYIGLDTLPDRTVGAAIGSMILADLAAFAGDRYNYSERNAPVNVLVDEVSEIINDPMLRVLNKARGAGVQVMLATQTFPDIIKRLGSAAGAQQAIGNTNSTIAMRLRDQMTKREVSGALPKVMIPQVSRSMSTRVDEERALSAAGGNVSESWSMREIELVSPSWLGKLPNFEYYAELAGGKVIKGKIPILR